MTFKYQLIFLGDIANPACEAIKKRFHEKIIEMGLLDDAFIEIHASNFKDDYQNKQPSFAIILVMLIIMARMLIFWRY